jgi:hypothetical protein
MMKCVSVVLFMILGASGALAQDPTTTLPAPGLTVVQLGWHKETYVPALYDDPLTRNQEHDELEREQKATLRQNVVRAQSGQLPLPVPTRPVSTSRSDPSSTYYRYEAKVKSTAAKTIREVAWVYSFYEPGTEIQIGTHEYTSKVNLRPGKTASLIGISNTPPNGVVSVSKSGDAIKNKYVEHVVIVSIEFDDGTFWKRP